MILARTNRRFPVKANMATHTENAPSPPMVHHHHHNIPNATHEMATFNTDGRKRPTSRLITDSDATSFQRMRKSSSQSPSQGSDVVRSPRKLSSPDKRFPVRPYSPQKQSEPAQSPSIEDVLRDNEGLTREIEMIDADKSDSEEEHFKDTVTSMKTTPDIHDESNMDDTIISTFSNFSAVPETTMYSKIKQTPSKLLETIPTSRIAQITPKSARLSLSAHSFRNYRDEDNTTNLLDITDPIDMPAEHASPAKFARLAALRSSRMLNIVSTPASNRHTIPSILDFDIPPAPTPKSLPTITPRELESLKSQLLSEISSLKASLSGKEAEVLSLKAAVGDAEKRVGESMEQMREDRNQIEHLAREKEIWETRGREMEALLISIKEKMVHSEQEKNELGGRLEESEARRQAAEHMAQEAESKLAAIKAGKPSPEIETKSEGSFPNGNSAELAVEKISRELHALYKEKHETKVGALKKSYERRWDKSAKEFEKKIDDLMKENEELKSASSTVKMVAAPEASEELAHQPLSKEVEAELKSLSEAVRTIKDENMELQKLLDSERLEKGHLVQTVEEMLPLISSFDDLISDMDRRSPVCSKCTTNPLSSSSGENFRGSVSKTSGLRAPSCHSGLGESRIGKGGYSVPGNQEKIRSRSISTLARPTSGFGHRSGILNSIEKMGNYKGRGDR